MEESRAYLESQDAFDSIDCDPYWPKWDSPWWHLLLIHELGRDAETSLLTAKALLEGMREKYLPTFFPEDFPPERNPAHHAACFCAFGTIFPAFERAGLELFVESKAGPRTPEETKFVHGLARDLLTRQLLYSYPGTSNAEEAEDEEDWRNLTFPRFYFYDVLRGLTAITRYAERLNTKIPGAALKEAITLVEEKSKQGPLKIEYNAILPLGTLAFSDREWKRIPASTFSPLEKTNRVGDISPSLELEWKMTKARIQRLHEKGLIEK